MSTPARGRVEKPGEAQNIVWQTRTAEPTAFENRVGDALEKAFASGVEELPALIESLRAQGCLDPQGQPWTEESLQAWLRQRA